MNEKLRILKMLESGQISADEAARLLQSVDAPAQPTPPPVPPAPSASFGNNGPRPGAGSSGSFASDDFTRKFEGFARDMAPKVQKFAESAVGAIVNATDKVSGAFSSATASSSPSARPVQQHAAQMPRAAAPVPHTPRGTTVMEIEQLVEIGAHNEINLQAIGGDLRIKGYNGDKITARISYTPNRAGAPIELVKLGGKYFLNYESDDFKNVSIDAYIPASAFSVIKLEAHNGTVDCSSLNSNYVDVLCQNGTTILKEITTSHLKAENANGHFTLSKIMANVAEIENMNGQLECAELDIAELKLAGFNSPVSILMSGFRTYSDYKWSVETGNAKLSINLPTMPDIGYHIKAHAAMGDVRVGLTGLQFIMSERSLVEARSVSFASAGKKILIAAETSNSPLIIA